MAGYWTLGIISIHKRDGVQSQPSRTDGSGSYPLRKRIRQPAPCETSNEWQRIYLVIVHKDADSAAGVAVLDYPGWFTTGDTIEEALGNVQETIALYMTGETMDLPDPFTFEDVAKTVKAEGGAIIVADLDPTFPDKRVARINITVPRYAPTGRRRPKASRGRSFWGIATYWLEQ